MAGNFDMIIYFIIGLIAAILYITTIIILDYLSKRNNPVAYKKWEDHEVFSLLIVTVAMTIFYPLIAIIWIWENIKNRYYGNR